MKRLFSWQLKPATRDKMEMKNLSSKPSFHKQNAIFIHPAHLQEVNIMWNLAKTTPRIDKKILWTPRLGMMRTKLSIPIEPEPHHNYGSNLSVIQRSQAWGQQTLCFWRERKRGCGETMQKTTRFRFGDEPHDQKHKKIRTPSSREENRENN